LGHIKFYWKEKKGLPRKKNGGWSFSKNQVMAWWVIELFYPKEWRKGLIRKGFLGGKRNGWS